MQTAPPLISVVMPVWNAERYLAEAIDSVLSQTHTRFELVIVDDGSEDRSREIIARYAESDARLRPIYAAHRGLVATLNAGCRAAHGHYIARLDSDDIALPERLEAQVRFLEENSQVALLGSGSQCINAAGQRCAILSKPPLENAAIRHGLLRANLFCHSTIMMRTDVFREIGGYRALYAEAEDYDLWTRFADRHELACIPPVLVLYRIHAGQVSVTRLEQQALVAQTIAVATEMRWRTGIDPLARGDAIDRGTLRDLGVDDDQVDVYLLNTYLRYLALLPGLGLTKAGLDVLRQVTTHASFRAQLAAAPDGCS